MKRHVLFSVISVFTILFSITCKKEKQFEMPLVQTGEVTDIDSTGAVFHGKIMFLGTDQVIDFGFEWNDKNDFSNPGTIYTLSLGIPVENQNFSFNVRSALISEKRYYVRTYVRSEHSVTYGQVLSFTSLGSEAPEIIDINPKIATWGDTIMITGKNFSCKKSENFVEFFGFDSDVVFSNDTLAKALVPTGLDTSNIDITLAVHGNKSIGKSKFKLLAPEITSFTPQIGTYQTIVEITGKYFHPAFTTVKFDTKQALILGFSANKISVVVPKDLRGDEIDLSVTTAKQKTLSDKKFFCTNHLITDFFPKIATFEEEITILGKRFSNNISEIEVKFGSIIADVTEATPDRIKVKIPNSLQKQNTCIAVKLNNQSISAIDTFILKSPSINSFSPNIGTFGDEITIQGENFNPIIQNNSVSLGNSLCTVVFASKETLKVLIPNDFFSNTGKAQFSISCGEVLGTSANEFELINHSISSFTPNYGSRGDTITIIGQNFNPAFQYNIVKIGNGQARVISSDKNQMQCVISNGVVHGNQTISVIVGGKEIGFATPFTIYEPWTRLSDFGGGKRKFAYGFAINGKGYIGGGCPDYNDIDKRDLWEYDPGNDSWKKVQGFYSEYPYAFCSTLQNGYVFSRNSFMCYDPAMNLWTQKADYPGSYAYGKTAFAVGSFIVAGTGTNYGYNGYTQIWKYNQSNGSWYDGGNFPGGGSSYAVSFVINGIAYMGLGHTNNNYLWKYFPMQNMWYSLTNLQGTITGLQNLRRIGAVGISCNGLGYIFGGSIGSSSSGYETWIPTTELYQFNPINNRCIRLPDIPSDPRMQAVGFSINGKIYIGTGQKTLSNYSICFSDFWEFDPSKLKPSK